MATTKQLNIQYGGDVAKLRKAHGEIDRMHSSFGRKVSDTGKRLTTGLTLPILGAGVAALKLASDADETENKVRVIFGRMADDVVGWSDTAIDKMGLASQTAQDLASQFAGLFQTAKLPAPEVLKLSKGFTQLAADAASFHNVPIEEAFMALRSGLSGESEPLRRFNVFLNETAVQTEAVRLGLVKQGEELTEQQKITARASLIQKQMAKASGDYARTQDSVANQTRASIESLKELGAELGKELIPIAKDLLEVVRGWIDRFRELSPEQRQMILKSAALAAALGPVLTIVGKLTTGLGGLARGFGASSKAAGAWGVALGLVATAGYKVHEWMQMDERKAREWTASILDGTHTLEDYEAAIRKVVMQDGIVDDAEWKVLQAYEKAVVDVKKAHEKLVDPILEGTAAENEWGVSLRQSGAMSVEHKRKIAALLVTTERYDVELNRSQELTLRNMLKTGDWKGALNLLERALKGVLGPLKNALTYTERQAEAAGDAAQKNQRYAYWLSQIGEGGGGGGGGGGGTYGGAGGQKQHGGPVEARRSYIVGERGPELYTPDRSGVISPLTIGGGGGTVVVNVYAGMYVHQRDVARELQRVLLELQRRNGGRLGFAA